jgi:hypothetical protein
MSQTLLPTLRTQLQSTMAYRFAYGMEASIAFTALYRSLRQRAHRLFAGSIAILLEKRPADMLTLHPAGCKPRIKITVFFYGLGS